MAHKSLRGRRKASISSARSTIKSNLKKGQKKNKKDDKADPAAEAKPKPNVITLEPGKKNRKEARKQSVMERHHRALYSTGERILLVGEGNFSFARALCRNLNEGAGVYATAFDSEATLNKKYSDASAIRKEIEERFGGTTLVGVDATRLHSVREFKRSFKKIVWNFPHAGSGETDVDKSIAEHQQLLTSFFKSAARCLDTSAGARIHVALKEGEPYKSWKVVQVAHAAGIGLELKTVVPFAVSAWPDYAHRRTIGFDEKYSKAESEELAKGAKVFVFAKQPEE